MFTNDNIAYTFKKHKEYKDLFYQLSPEAAAGKLKVDLATGLSPGEAKRRLGRWGPNTLTQERKSSIAGLLLSQFKDVLIIILLVAAVVSLGLGMIEEDGAMTEGILILVIVAAIALVGFLNEYKAEKTVEALKKLAALKATTRRAGKIQPVAAGDLVPGDVVLLEAGSRVPADLRLTEAYSLEADEASLTGESQPVAKDTNTIKEEVGVGDRQNMLFSGTVVTAGKGAGIITATGMQSEIGRIAHLVESEPDSQTPMQMKLDHLGKQLGAIVLAVCVIVFAAILLFSTAAKDLVLAQRLLFAFTAAVALAVAAIPEGLAFVVRISLALGARRMAAKKALVRHLAAVEALGSTDTICCDKTGTLTAGKMTLTQIWTASGTIKVSGSGYDAIGQFTRNDQPLNISDELDLLLRIGVLCNNAEIGETISGDPTEAALLVAADKAGLHHQHIREQQPKLYEVPFSSERKMMSTLHRDDTYLVAAKGATEVLLDHCDAFANGSKKSKLSDKEKQNILHQSQVMASQALRVLALAYKRTDSSTQDERQVESGLVFLGLVGIMDPPRLSIKPTIETVTKTSGLRVVMITGDHAATAQAVAAQIGIAGETMTGDQLEAMSEHDLKERVLKVSIYARVNPEHKLKIVKALKSHGHQVAMTGDGVNDAPAIKAADIGIAMGVSGTDVAKETADLILLDDHFQTIIMAIKEGRGIFENVRKFVNYLLSANIAEILIVLGGVLAFGKLVVSAVQLLFINVVTDGLPAVALGSDQAPRDVMRRGPSEFQARIIDGRLWIEMFIFGGLMTVIVLAEFIYNHALYGLDAAVAQAFAAIVVLEMVRLVMIRRDSKIKWNSNPWLLVAVTGSFALLAGVLYWPPAQSLFELSGLRLVDWGQIALASVLIFVLMLPVKHWLRRPTPQSGSGLSRQIS